MNKFKLLLLALVAPFLAIAAHATDYADVAAAKTAVEAIPDTVTPVYLAFLTLSVGAFIIGMVVRFAKRGSSTR